MIVAATCSFVQVTLSLRTVHDGFREDLGLIDGSGSAP